MKPRKPSPAQRRQRNLAWLLHQSMGAQGSVRPADHRVPLPPAVAVELRMVQEHLGRLSAAIYYELGLIQGSPF